MKDVKPKLVVGLGNPGDEYRYTRHNVGAWYIHALANRYSGEFKLEKKFFGEVAEIFVNGNKVRLLFPTTFMNLSGKSIRALSDYFSIAPEEILVAYDDLDLDVADVRLKFSGGHGGHNGLRDTHKHLGKDYWRLRIGVGHPGDKKKVSNYLTKNKPSSKEEALLLTGIKKAVDDFADLLEGGYEKMMQKWHSKPASDNTKPKDINNKNTTAIVKTTTKPSAEASKQQTDQIALIRRSSREGKQLNAKTALQMAFDKAKSNKSEEE